MDLPRDDAVKLCKCGAIVEGRCGKCHAGKHGRTTTQRGYGHDWRVFSERFRTDVPLCQVCEMRERVKPARQVHHIRKIVDAPQLRLVRSNCLAVCEDCHGKVEENRELAERAKAASDQEDD